MRTAHCSFVIFVLYNIMYLNPKCKCSIMFTVQSFKTNTNKEATSRFQIIKSVINRNVFDFHCFEPSTKMSVNVSFQCFWNSCLLIVIRQKLSVINEPVEIRHYEFKTKTGEDEEKKNRKRLIRSEK